MKFENEVLANVKEAHECGRKLCLDCNTYTFNICKLAKETMLGIVGEDLHYPQEYRTADARTALIIKLPIDISNGVRQQIRKSIEEEFGRE